VKFSGNTPAAGAFQAVSVVDSGDGVSFIDAYITTTFS